MTPNTTAVNSSSTSTSQIPANLRPRAGHAENATPANADGNVRNSSAQSPAPTAATAQASSTATNALDRQKLSVAVDELNKQAKSLPKTNLQFSMDDESGVMVVKVMDVENDEVIRQIPREEALEMAAFLKEVETKKAQGIDFTVPGARGSATSSSALEGLLLHVKA